MNKYKIILFPLLIAFITSAFYVCFFPGKIKGDAIEYDSLANSILIGEYSFNGVPSMEREPGYPFFRAVLKTVSDNSEFILFIQVILFCATIYFVGKTSLLIDPLAGWYGFIGASLSYGLAFYASTHISEVLTGFLLSLIGFNLVSGMIAPSRKFWIYLSVLSSLLIMTRYPYILVIPAFIILLYKSSLDKNVQKSELIKNFLISILIISAVLSPWLIRNYTNFKVVNIAGRSGAGLYARAWKSNESWSRLKDSYISSIIGRGLIYRFYPNNQSIWLEQWGDWWRNPEVAKLWGDTAAKRDEKAKEMAFELIFKNFDNLSKFVVWTGVDTIRFLQIPNPAPQAYGASFEGTFGPLAQNKTIDSKRIAFLIFVHLIQLIWLFFIFASLYLGFKKYKIYFLPGVLLICILLVHSIADNTARYAAPLQPWILSGVFMTIIFPLVSKIKKLFY